MKLCETCQNLTTDEHDYCAHDGQRLVKDLIATALQESLGTKYTLTSLVGSGSMGAVYRAQHHQLDDVAIKVMLGPPSNHKLSQRFLREARALRKLRHPNSVLVYDLERAPTGLTYMVMEMVEGRSLRALLEERGHLTVEEMMEVAEAVCDALSAAHEHGIYHRDLKPDNILLAEEKKAKGEITRTIKIVDFGIVKLRGTDQGSEEASMQLTNMGAPIGTPFYMSPEQWFGDGPGFTALDGRTDIYSLGCTLYEMLAGRPPFIGETKEELRRKHLNDQPQPLSGLVPKVADGLNRAILRALEKDRDLRPATAGEFAAELRRAYDESVQSKVKAKPETAPAERASSTTAKGGRAKKGDSELQTTEESMPLIRDWAADEAQQAIEQVREHPMSLATPEAHAVQNVKAEKPVEQQFVEQPTQKPPAVRERVENRPAPAAAPPPVRTEPVRRPPTVPTSDEFRRTMILDGKPRRKAKTASRTAKEVKDNGQELMLAQVGTRRIGVLAAETEAVETWRTPIPLPHAPEAVLGIVSVRGRMLTVLDTRALLGEKAFAATGTPHAFLITLRGDEQLALAVDTVAGTIKINVDEHLTPGNDSGLVRGQLRDDLGEITLLNLRELFEAATQAVERRRQRT
ncbi:MAG TPA: protein kinase [Pyrinomonadaceae bacterium]